MKLTARDALGVLFNHNTDPDGARAECARRVVLRAVCVADAVENLRYSRCESPIAGGSHPDGLGTESLACGECESCAFASRVDEAIMAGEQSAIRAAAPTLPPVGERETWHGERVDELLTGIDAAAKRIRVEAERNDSVSAMHAGIIAQTVTEHTAEIRRYLASRPSPAPSGERSVVKAVMAWQKNPLVHPLTCGNHSDHSPLVPVTLPDGKVMLWCMDCDYKQWHIPASVLAAAPHPDGAA